MTIPHITPIQKLFEDSNLELDLSKNADGHYIDEVARYSWMNWMTAYSFGREHRENILNKAAEIALAEQATQSQFISADEARALGVGNAEWLGIDDVWRLQDGIMNPMYSVKLKYRAVHKEVPAEPHAEPHAELKALYSQQFKDGTLDCYLWEFHNKFGAWEFTAIPLFNPSIKYRCTPKPTCQVRNEDTGELKIITREAAQKLQAELGNAVEWYNPEKMPISGKIFAFDYSFGIYTYRRKVKKQVSWKDVPVGVALKLKADGRRLIFIGVTRGHYSICALDGLILRNLLPSEIELAPAADQDWIAVQDDMSILGLREQFRRDGFIFEFDEMRYRITGLAEGYKL